MTDIALRWFADLWRGDLPIEGGDLAQDDGLKTAILISLFTDAPARDDDPLPDGADRRGWWGDALATAPGDVTGSRLWLLAREKRLSSVLARARDYAREALQWLIDDGVAATVDVEARIVGTATLGIGVTITRPSAPGRQRFDFLWEGTG